MEYKIIVAGIGPGNPDYMVPEARRVIESARVLAGGRRALSQFAGENVQEQCVIGADIPAVMHAFAGIRACVCVLILNAVLKLRKGALKDKWSYIIFSAVFALSMFLDINAAILVIVAGFAGLLIKKLTGEATKNDAR